jgi:2-dehydropantoate 2-reductase
MQHAVLGAGGIGGLLAGALALSGADVTLVVRAAPLAGFDRRLQIESVVLGDFETEVEATSTLDRPVDVVWVATKATQLEAALTLIPLDAVGAATVVPLLNGIDHVALLRSRYPTVVAAAIRVESERVTPWHYRQSSPFLGVDMAGAPEVQAELRSAGIECRARHDEVSMLWDKLAFLAPIALATSAADLPVGGIRDDALFIGAREETIAAAYAEGAEIDADAIRRLHAVAPEDMRSSMQKDVAAGREPELDAIAGPIVRAGLRHVIPTPATSALVEQIRARAH